ncbi:chorismate mutase [Bombilactobacillus bombi]|nr:chorismate mutase [Bombilactobacillus bombi]MBA1434550.1 hypothetical protein [Bombilactobacillus bombi]
MNKENSLSSQELQDQRQEINKLDQTIIPLLIKRLTIAQKFNRLKLNNN